jgi:hypothetical protein
VPRPHAPRTRVGTALSGWSFPTGDNAVYATVLIVAGGGGGGYGTTGGGGGAGGLLEGSISLASGNSYTVTVGAGGAIKHQLRQR